MKLSVSAYNLVLRLQMNVTVPLFRWVLGIQNQVLRIVWQALYPINHLSSFLLYNLNVS